MVSVGATLPVWGSQVLVLFELLVFLLLFGFLHLSLLSFFLLGFADHRNVWLVIHHLFISLDLVVLQDFSFIHHYLLLSFGDFRSSP